uniref:Uncharacterized protein n=1 Tax=Chromera velia CCMP2878 TaxID=1169474 RepID=A0A0G4FID3_9ALVE|eukprot:Cvel_17151.t1-p1 / transcript=Cvel_17151.t1 / gene=Cvel_17151 / organism=Chromera_velia_CCMP2878 / gene_product=hypothetical protein / transcript_product=hypothetical protein / location=Cvel_scaffold1355:2841-7018(-) / protein_length=624 / sequence_SO=supercontig / SO=protein_coding / is_pseudo=false
MAGRELIRFWPSKLKHVIRNDKSIDIFVGTSKYSFAFPTRTDCDGFCESVELLYGVLVTETSSADQPDPKDELLRAAVGSKEDLEDDDDSSFEEGESDQKSSDELVLPGRALVETLLDPEDDGSDRMSGEDGGTAAGDALDDERSRREAAEREREEALIRDTQKHPIQISGKPQVGSPLSLQDFSGMQSRAPITVIEWNVSRNLGGVARDAEFSFKPVSVDRQFVPLDWHVGRYVRVLGKRRMPHSGTFATSASMTTRPIELSEETAADVQAMISRVHGHGENQRIPCELHPAQYAKLFHAHPESATVKAVRKQGYVEARAVITSTGLVLEVKKPEDRLRGFLWGEMRVERPQPKEVADRELQAADRLRLWIVVLAGTLFEKSTDSPEERRRREKELPRFQVDFQNEASRDCIFHTACTHKMLDGKIPPKDIEKFKADAQRASTSLFRQWHCDLYVKHPARAEALDPSALSIGKRQARVRARGAAGAAAAAERGTAIAAAARVAEEEAAPAAAAGPAEDEDETPQSQSKAAGGGGEKVCFEGGENVKGGKSGKSESRKKAEIAETPADEEGEKKGNKDKKKKKKKKSKKDTEEDGWEYYYEENDGEQGVEGGDGWEYEYEYEEA